MFELRYFVRPGWDGPEKVLQYRAQIEVSDYGAKSNIGTFITKKEWTEWHDVPTVEDK